jgi:2-iminobutanoate/2-iminopropanoate deaminase
MAPITRHPSAISPSFSDPVVVEGPGTWIEVSGQIGFEPDGSVPEDFEREVRLCFEHVRRSLQRGGGDLKDLVRIRVYLTDLSIYGTFSQVRGELLGEAPPASSAVQVAGLLMGAKIEIDASGFVPER